MSWIGNQLRADASMPPPDPVDRAFLAAAGIHSGAVTVSGAQAISTVWACVKVISETVSLTPAFVYERTQDGGKQRATDHPVYDLIHFRPNPYQTIFEFFELVTAHAVLRGNGYAWITPGRRGFADQLHPLHPDRVVPEWAPDGESIRYRIVDTRKNTIRTLLQDEVIHLRGRSEDGLLGLSTISQARRTLGLTQSAEQHGTQLFQNGANPGVVLEHPGELKGAAAQRLAAQFDSRHAGAQNTGKTLVLEEGMKAAKLSMSNDDAQFLETRQFQVAEICRWFRVQPHKVHDLSRATFGNIEHQSLEFVSDTILPWLKRWELALSSDLISAPNKYFIEFLVDGLLRGDAASRVAYYEAMTRMRTMSRNEIRARENLNPIDGGDEYPEAPVASSGDVISAAIADWVGFRPYAHSSNGQSREAVPHGS